MIKALAACAAVIALAGCASPIARTANGEIPPARIYIKSMTQQDVGLSAVEFSREAGMLHNQLLELAINDVVLAQITGGEHLTIWLKPGSYNFSIKPAQGLNSPAYTEQSKIDVQVKSGAATRLRIVSGTRGINLMLAP